MNKRMGVIYAVLKCRLTYRFCDLLIVLYIGTAITYIFIGRIFSAIVLRIIVIWDIMFYTEENIVAV